MAQKDAMLRDASVSEEKNVEEDEKRLQEDLLHLVKSARKTGKSSRELCVDLQIEADGEMGARVKKMLSKMSFKPSSSRLSETRKDKPLVRVEREAARSAKKEAVRYVYGGFLAQAEKQCCMLCGNEKEMWNIAGDYSGSRRRALIRGAFVHTMCEMCFRKCVLGESNPLKVGIAVLPVTFFNKNCAAAGGIDLPDYYQPNAISARIVEIEDGLDGPMVLVGVSKDRIVRETLNEVRQLGIRGGTWHDITERVRVALLPDCIDNLKDVVQYTLGTSSSLDVQSCEPLLRKAMIGTDGSVQVLFVAREFVDPETLGNNRLSAGIRVELAEKQVSNGLFPYSTFRILIQDHIRSALGFESTVEEENGGSSALTPCTEDSDGDSFNSSTRRGFEIIRRYSDFIWLRKELSKWHKDEAFIHPLPEGKYIGRFSSSFLDQRMHGLEHFLSIIATHPVLHKAEALQCFLKNAPLEQVKQEYIDGEPSRQVRHQDRRSFAGVGAVRPLVVASSMDSFRGHALTGSPPSSPKKDSKASSTTLSMLFSWLRGSSPNTLPVFLASLGLPPFDCERLRYMLSSSFTGDLENICAKMEAVGGCHLSFAKFHEKRANACKLLAQIELSEYKRAEKRTVRTSSKLYEIPLSEKGLTSAMCSRTVMEIFSVLGRIDALSSLAQRGSWVRSNEVRMHLDEWNQSLTGYARWFTNRLVSVNGLEESARNKDELLRNREDMKITDSSPKSSGGSGRTNEGTAVSSTSSSSSYREDVDEAIAKAIERIKVEAANIREDTRQEGKYLLERNQQEIVGVLTTFVHQRIEHARQMSRLWQDFMSQISSALESKEDFPPLELKSRDRRSSTVEESDYGARRIAPTLHKVPSKRSDSSDHQSMFSSREDSRSGVGELGADDFQSILGFSDEEDTFSDGNNNASSFDNQFVQEIDPSDIILGESIGRGSFGQVHEAVYHGRRVAVKKFHTASMSSKSLIYFRREARIMQLLPPHPNVISFFGYCSRPGNVCLVMELVESGSLIDLLLYKKGRGVPTPYRKRVEQGGVNNKGNKQSHGDAISHNITVRRKYKAQPKKDAKASSPESTGSLDLDSLDEKWRLKLALGTARGLQELHNQKPQILHRDIKSSNLLVVLPELIVKVADFGLARFKLEDQAVRSFVGTAAWVAPEVIQSNSGTGYSAKADVYSFAIVLWQIYAQAVPYPRKTPSQVIFEVSTAGLRPRMPENVPSDVKSLIEKCWAQKPDQRPNFDYIVKALSALYNGDDFSDQAALGSTSELL